jgi:hypothetical protein
LIIKSIVLAVILLLGSLGIAAAQSSEPHGTLGHGQPNEDGPITQAIVIGFNFYHASYCTTPTPGLFIFVAREDNSAWFTADVATMALLTPACQTGNFVGIHVTNIELVFDQVIVFPFK